VDHVKQHVARPLVLVPQYQPRAAPAMTASDQALASVIRRMRTELGITQEGLAFRAEVTVATLSRIERGVTNPAWTTVVKIAQALRVTPQELVATAEAAREPPTELDPDAD
jgi:transcriptional regulator with XRE-family HTH domain